MLLGGKQILAKEEINLNLYVRNKTNGLKEAGYLKRLKQEDFWEDLRKPYFWRPRKPKLTAKQMYNTFYTKVLTPNLDLNLVKKLMTLIKNLKQ